MGAQGSHVGQLRTGLGGRQGRLPEAGNRETMAYANPPAFARGQFTLVAVISRNFLLRVHSGLLHLEGQRHGVNPLGEGRLERKAVIGLAKRKLAGESAMRRVS